MRSSPTGEELLMLERLATAQRWNATLREETARLRQELSVEQRSRASDGESAAARTRDLKRQIPAYTRLFDYKERTREAGRRGHDKVEAALRADVVDLRRLLAAKEHAHFARERAHSDETAKITAMMARLKEQHIYRRRRTRTQKLHRPRPHSSAYRGNPLEHQPSGARGISGARCGGRSPAVGGRAGGDVAGRVGRARRGV